MISLIILILFYNLSFSVLSQEPYYFITPNENLTDGVLLFSTEEVFVLGFFTPKGSTYRYVGIWYNNIPIRTTVWVANRQAPLKTTSNVVLSLSSDGNLAISNLTGGVLWSTNTSNMSNPIVQLLDSGNLVLTEGVYDDLKNSNIVWQSFDYPSDTMLPGMKLGQDRSLISWLSTSDPSPRPYSYGVGRSGMPELYIWNGSATESRAEPWNRIYTGAPTFGVQFITTNGEVYYKVLNSSVTLLIFLNESGIATMRRWQGEKWVVFADSPADRCDRYGQCGAFGVCNIVNVSSCSCLKGFEPQSPVDWAQQNTSGGCVRRTSLYCPNDGDGFVPVSGVELPDTKEAMLRNDFSFDQCDLVDIKELQDGDGGLRETLYVRLSGSEFGISPTNPRKKRNAHVVVIVAVSLAVIILCSLMLLTWIRCKHTWKKLSAEKITLPFGIGMAVNPRESEKALMSPLYPLSGIIQATDNFSNVNKLGEGGFGPVYKGKLVDGQEIAVKRLAAKSGQGQHEFENEIIIIAKLQHTNLVRLMGYCIHGEEKILIYEYMPNKSLDYFLYDTTRRAQLDWSRRLHIIEGISQGLLYLHKHSRLRIIHRDLKASNILLDADMNPKISDFGLARIFGMNETEANTNRIVGTYGYMSPEYAAEGLFSIKSDVFSFGVLLLEIVSGSKNTSYHRDGNTLNLLGYAWELWKEAKLLELFDSSFDGNCPKNYISRCIHIALMCVQENATDRPNMSAVVGMLNSDSAIADPKQPAFFNVRNTVDEVSHSVNEMTITTISVR